MDELRKQIEEFAKEKNWSVTDVLLFLLLSKGQTIEQIKEALK